MQLGMKYGNDLAVSRMRMIQYFSSVTSETIFIKCKLPVLIWLSTVP
jgi:hypothetical protein